MSPNVNKYLVVIAGPTAAGKTATAIQLAKRFDSVIVSADSRQIFREMTIGTAKPEIAELKEVKHYFIDHLSVSEPYSAGRYAEECEVLLGELFREHRVVFLVGGAGMYIRSVIEGFHHMPHVPDKVRNKWEQKFETEGIGSLQDSLRKADPEFVPVVDMQNPRRLIRALSLIEVSGKTVTTLRQQARAEIPYEIVRVLCNLPREVLYERIRSRVDDMMEAGLLDEVKSLLPFKDMQAMQTVGYAELVNYLDGKLTIAEAVEKIKQHSCNYAKRQLTWFRNQGDWSEFNPPDVDAIESFINQIVKL